jgi:hypothetical protein
VVHGRREPGVNRDQKFWPDGLRSDEVLPHRETGVNRDRKCALGDLPNDVALHRRVSRALGVSHDRTSEPGGRREFREVRGRLPETCCGVPEVLDSSRVACRQRPLGEHRVSRVSHELGVRHDRKCAVRGLPSVKLVHPLQREACVGRGRQLQMLRGSLNDRRDHRHKFLRFQNAR